MGHGAEDVAHLGSPFEAHEISRHLHSVGLLYPVGAAPVTLTSGAGAYTLGTVTEIIPASTVTEPFDIHFAVISNPSANDDYEIELYQGVGDTLIACIGFVRTAVFTSAIYTPVLSTINPANARIRAAMRDGTGSRTADIKLVYHKY